ncbi:MAG: phage DNA encapsidation protein, partial [Lachnospiraceae bacterium]|nr:phage DNA encapsidation protein [Lachnospiraceae bacterium]
IVFDEFMTRSGYLNNEFVRFMNLLSTLIRDRENAVVYMLACLSRHSYV